MLAQSADTSVKLVILLHSMTPGIMIQ